ncbi:nucleoside triphosphate pyrophosphohydrolase family protein [Moellerella wisconsensis]|uniref:Nucleoside triphosphate pyrophosphohydrolase family protein n=1 Tax=Moellerella wisconsensis TaxID=158849 RepID=A0ACD3YEB4_9GAMM|nr:nucleoside triphosphate pyrophosphohydrolase family protein [Moellerella wisconsensis]UNH40956.1 nucleoside triphosphate pyrophosphohydrolase family protein [Moellerella wisconsensis]
MINTMNSLSLKAVNAPSLQKNKYITSLHTLVKEFHQVFDHPIDSKNITPELLRLRASLIREEAKEGEAAWNDEDEIELLDAIGDTVYVLVGTLVSFDNSMSRVLSLKHGDLENPTVYTKAISNLYSSFSSDLEQSFEMAMATADGLDEIAGDLEKGRLEIAENALSLLPYFISDCLSMFNYTLEMAGVSLIEVVSAIHESNMTKLWASNAEERQKQIEECKYERESLAFRPCLSRDGMIGYRLADGKILKSPSYTPVDLSVFADQLSY